MPPGSSVAGRRRAPPLPDAEADGSFELAVTVPAAAVPGEADLGARFAAAMFDDGYVSRGDTVEVLGE